MERARVAPAAVDKEGDTAARQHEIWRASVGQPAVKTEASARSMKSLSKHQLRHRVDPAPPG